MAVDQRNDHPEDDLQDAPAPELGVFMDSLVEDGKGWLTAQKSLTKLVVGERVGKISGTLIATMILLFLVMSTLLIGSVALGIWWGEQIGDVALGFLYVCLVHLGLVLLFILFGRKAVRDSITLHVINSVHADDQEIQ